jgi:beta-glucosidase
MQNLMIIRILFILLLATINVPMVLGDQSPVYRDKTAPVEARVEDLLRHLTANEKLTLIGGFQSSEIYGIPRVGLPAIVMADGPLGIRNGKPSTVYPATIGLAASWDSELAQEFGVSLGRDCRARGIHILLGPAMNIIREPQGGRNFECLSEDPVLAAKMAVAIVKGIQSQRVVATVKHYAANNQEANRMSVNVVLSERVLREIYLPAFRASIQQGGAWAVMDAYNRLNGSYCTANSWLNTTVLKKEWGFRGVVMSDWKATHDTLGAANGGLDLEMPKGEFLNASTLKPLIDAGSVSMATLDDKVRRILRLEFANGFFGREQTDSSILKDDPRSAAVALKGAREAIVLLKNEKQILPLDRAKMHSIAVLGASAMGNPAGGGSSMASPFHYVSTLDGLRSAAGSKSNVKWLGLSADAIFQKLFPKTTFDGPLNLEIRNSWHEKDPLAQMPVAAIDHDWTDHPPTAVKRPDDYYMRWTGHITPKASGRYDFIAKTRGGTRVTINGQQLIEVWDYDDIVPLLATKILEAGRTYIVEVTYTCHRPQNSYMHFAWGLAPPLLTQSETAYCRGADAVIVCVGYNSQNQREGHDRPYELPLEQLELVKAATDLNSRTVVVLNSGGGVATQGWIDRVPALLQAWYPGQEGGRALAEIVFGDINPSGKLPISFEKRWEDCAAYGRYPFTGGNKSDPLTASDEVDYSEGVFVGYRWFDLKGIEPLFPFGFGLSYTKFQYANERVLPAADGGYMVTFDITNTGSREGAEIAQIYVATPPSKVPRPVRELKAFSRVLLKPGETRTVTTTLTKDAFAYFDEDRKSWVVEPGRYAIIVGSSSREFPLREAVEVQ